MDGVPSNCSCSASEIAAPSAEDPCRGVSSASDVMMVTDADGVDVGKGEGVFAFHFQILTPVTNHKPLTLKNRILWLCGLRFQRLYTSVFFLHTHI